MALINAVILYIYMTSNSKLMTHKEETHKIQKEKN